MLCCSVNKNHEDKNIAGHLQRFLKYRQKLFTSCNECKMWQRHFAVHEIQLLFYNVLGLHI